jgi:hypothetical protein
MPKKGQKGVWSEKGVPDLWEEPKKRIGMALTQFAADALTERANEMGISRSELVERFARGLVGLPEQEKTAKKSRKPKPSLTPG